MQRPTLPPLAGTGFKPQHLAEILSGSNPAGFFEVHAENYLGAGGPPLRHLDALRRDRPLSLHGVALSLGGVARPDAAHLARLRALCDRVEPASFSEHLAWSSHHGTYLNDLLPLPTTPQTLAQVVRNVDEVQAMLRRRILIENPSSYMRFAESSLEEPDFLDELCRRTGCGLLLDVANIFVSAVNLGLDPRATLLAYPLGAVEEVHLAGHEATIDRLGAPLLLDTHGSAVPTEVWALYETLLERIGPIATLVEWDSDVPAWPVLRAEVEAAGLRIDQARRHRDALLRRPAPCAHRHPAPCAPHHAIPAGAWS